MRISNLETRRDKQKSRKGAWPISRDTNKIWHTLKHISKVCKATELKLGIRMYRGILTHKIRATSTLSYLSDHIRPRESTRQLHYATTLCQASTMPLLHRPTTRTHFADRALRCCAPSVWNSLDSETLHCSSLS